MSQGPAEFQPEAGELPELHDADQAEQRQLSTDEALQEVFAELFIPQAADTEADGHDGDDQNNGDPTDEYAIEQGTGRFRIRRREPRNDLSADQIDELARKYNPQLIRHLAIHGDAYEVALAAAAVTLIVRGGTGRQDLGYYEKQKAPLVALAKQKKGNMSGLQHSEVFRPASTRFQAASRRTPRTRTR